MGLISKKQAAAINAKAEEHGPGADKIIPLGLQVLTMIGAEGKQTNGGKNTVNLEWQLPGSDAFTITEYHVIEDEESVGAKILAGKLQTAGKDGLIECDTIEELAAYVNKVMKGKKYQAVVRHEEYLKEKDGKIFKNTSAKIAYIGAMGEDLSVDPSKLLKPLEGEQLAKWKEYNAQNGRGATPSSKNDLAIDDDDADLPETDDLEDRIPTDKAKPVLTGKTAPAKKAAPKAAVVEEEEEETTTAGGDDEEDLDLV